MKSRFYSHLVEVHSLRIALDSLSLSPEEKDHLVQIAEENMHHVILQAILSELSEEDKRLFLSHVAKDQHDEVWRLLTQKVDTIEKKIQQAADDVKTKLHQDIADLKDTPKA